MFLGEEEKKRPKVSKQSREIEQEAINFYLGEIERLCLFTQEEEEELLEAMGTGVNQHRPA